MSILSAFALSLIQFAFILTASRSRKMRIAVATKILLSTNRHDFRQVGFLKKIFGKFLGEKFQNLSNKILKIFKNLKKNF